VEAIIDLGLLYRTGGQGVPKNDQKAREFFEHAVLLDPNHVIALTLLSALLKTPGQGFPTDEARAATLLNRAFSINPERTRLTCKSQKIEMPASFAASPSSNTEVRNAGKSLPSHFQACRPSNTEVRSHLSLIRKVCSRFLGMFQNIFHAVGVSCIKAGRLFLQIPTKLARLFRRKA
jgi:hypothetical protein